MSDQMSLRQAYKVAAGDAIFTACTATTFACSYFFPPVALFYAAAMGPMLWQDWTFREGRDTKGMINDSKEAAKVIVADLKSRLSFT